MSTTSPLPPTLPRSQPTNAVPGQTAYLLGRVVPNPPTHPASSITVIMNETMLSTGRVSYMLLARQKPGRMSSVGRKNRSRCESESSTSTPVPLTSRKKFASVTRVFINGKATTARATVCLETSTSARLEANRCVYLQGTDRVTT